MFDRLKRLFDRFQPLLVIAAMFLLLGIAMALVVGAPLAGQAPGPTIRADSVQATSTGYAVQLSYTTPPRDSLVVVKRVDAGKESLVARYAASTLSASYSRKVTMSASATGRYTFTARHYAGGKLADSATVAVQVGPAPVAKVIVTVVHVDTTFSTRTAGDTTFTTRRIVTTVSGTDTAVSVTFTVVPPAVLAAVDSVRLATPKVPTWDTTKVSVNYGIWPHPAGQTWTIHWLVNGALALTSIQAQVTSSGIGTGSVPRPTTATASIVACVRKSGDTSPEVCSPAVSFTQPGVSVTPTPGPTAPASSLTSFAIGGPPATPRVLPIWAQYTGSPLRIMVRDSASGWNVDFKVPPATLGLIPASLAGIDHPVGTIPLPSGPLVLSACAEVPATDSLVYRLCTPPARLP